MESVPMFHCLLCPYTSNSKYNYNRHVNLKHTQDPVRYPCDGCDGCYTSSYFLKRHKLLYCKKRLPQNVTEVPQNVTPTPQNVTEVPQNVTTLPQNVTEVPQNVTEVPQNVTDHTCPKCSKIFVRKDNMTRHINICKGVESALKCPKCHTRFSNRFLKRRHLKQCSALTVSLPSIENNLALQPTPQTQQQPLVNTITNQHQVGHIINNQPIQNNNYIITFTADRRERINFNADHMTSSVLENIIKSCQATDEYTTNTDIVSGLADHLLKVIVNRCVRKKNCRASYSEVHVGENKWEQRHDSEIYDKFLTDMTELFIGLVNRNKEMIKVSTNFIEELDGFLNYMADRGYCNDDDENRNALILDCYKQLVKRLKVKILNR